MLRKELVYFLIVVETDPRLDLYDIEQLISNTLNF